MSSKEFMDHFNDPNVDFKEILFSGYLELLRKYLCDNCSSTRSVWHSSDSLNNIGEFLFKMKKEGYDSECLIQIPVLIEKGEEISEGILYNIYIDGGIGSYFSFDITNELPLDCAVYGTQLCPKERITKKKLLNKISKLSLNEKDILESKDGFGYKTALMDLKINERFSKCAVIDYAQIYHSRTIRDLIKYGSITGNKSIVIKYITNVYDNNDKVEIYVNLTYVDGLSGEKYKMNYIISGSNGIDDKIKDCHLSIVKKIWNKEITVNGIGNKIMFKEYIIYEKKVSYKEFIKSIK